MSIVQHQNPASLAALDEKPIFRALAGPYVRRMRFRIARPGRLCLPLLLCLLTAVAVPDLASANAFLPAKGKIFTGVAMGSSVSDFQRRTGKHPAVWQQFIRWGGSYLWAFDWARSADTRLMLHLGTSDGQNLAESISPSAIAHGRGDRWILRLAEHITSERRPVYIRLMAEMNNCDLPYSSYDCNGSRRNLAHSPARFKQAWKRVVILMRGGSTAHVDQQLHRLHLPAARTGADQLPAAPVAFLWSPMTGGSPQISALRPEVYWPGSRWVDWVSTSFYSRFPNFAGLSPYYSQFAGRYHKPFAFGEWAIWGADSAAFTRQLFGWVRSHKRVRMMIYNQGKRTDGPFRLRYYPDAQSVLHGALTNTVFASLAPEFQ